MRFKPDKRLIDLMVGQLFYNSPDVAMRELLQNAEDACALQKLQDPAYESRILVRYSVKENWVEVLDNGLGMNEEAVNESFAAVGAPKENVSHLRELLAKARSEGRGQIAFFGVGILSCFGVAERVQVRTKMDNQAGLAFLIPDYHEDFQLLHDLRAERGTEIRLYLKPQGPMKADHVPSAVGRYARHAEHVEIEDVDSGKRQPVEAQWIGKGLKGGVAVADAAVRAGYLALHSAWDQPGGSLPSSVVLCNGGFLVKDREFNLLPQQAIGYTGELDVKPGELTIQLNREGFIQDQKWQDLNGRLGIVYNSLIRTKLEEWESLLPQGAKTIVEKGVEQAVVLLTRGPARGILEADTVERLDKLFPAVFCLRVRGAQTPQCVAELIEQAKENGTIYYIREDEGPRHFESSLQHGADTVQIRETAQTQELRATHLQAKGAMVITCRKRNYAYEVNGSSQNFSPHEADLVSQECQRAGLRFIHVNDASPEDVALAGASESTLLSEMLGLGEQFKFVALTKSQDRVIRDYAGRLLNCHHPEVREVLRSLPEAIGNPVRRALLQIYMDLSSYRFEEARQRTKELLTMPNLSELAQLSTGEFLRAYLVKLLQSLTEQPMEKS